MPSIVRHPIILHAFKKEKRNLCIKLQHPISGKMPTAKILKCGEKNVHLRIDERMC